MGDVAEKWIAHVPPVRRAVALLPEIGPSGKIGADIGAVRAENDAAVAVEQEHGTNLWNAGDAILQAKGADRRLANAGGGNVVGRGANNEVHRFEGAGGLVREECSEIVVVAQGVE